MAAQDASTFWHGFTNMRRFGQRSVNIVEADGAWVKDDKGNAYLNAYSSLVNLNLGGSQTEIADAISRQAHRLPYFTIERATHDAAEEYARRLTRLTPDGLNTVFYASTGAEANETVFKLMRQYQRVRHGKDTEKLAIITLDRGFHGVTYGAISATGSSFRHWREPFEPLVPGFHHAPSPYAYRCSLGCGGTCDVSCADAVETMIERLGPDKVAGVMVEPVLGVGGVLMPPPGYHERLRELCDRHDVLLAFDEVITGFGRLGTWFGADYFGVVPDFMSLSKGINGGYLPFAAVVLKEEIYDTFLTGVDGFVPTGSTNNGNPICCASGIAALDVMERDGIVDRVARNGKYMFEKFSAFLDYPIVGDIRGAGLLMGIELVRNKETREPIPAHQWQIIEDRIALSGLILGSSGSEGIGGNIGVAPPLTIETGEIDEIYDRLDGVFSRYAKLIR